MKKYKISSILNSLSYKEKILLAILIVVSIFFVYYNYLIIPTLDKLQPLRSEVESLRSEDSKYEDVENTITMKEKDLGDLRSKYEEASKVLPKIDRYPELSKDLNGLVTKNSLILNRIIMGKGQGTQSDSSSETGTNIEANQGKIGLNTQQVTLEITGDFVNILKLIDDLEKGTRICEINSITSTKENTTINLNFYYSSGDMEENYDFNSGSYGKDNMFN